MALSLEEYLKAKKEGRVKVGESVFKAAQSGLDSANDLVQRTQRQQSGQDKLWEREDIVKNLKSAKDYRNDALDVLTRFYSGDKKGAEYESLSKSAKENMKTVSDYLGKRNMATETTLENPNQWFDPERVRSNNAQGFVDSMTNNAFFENKNKAAANSTEMLENIAKDSGDLTERTWARQKKEAIEEQGKAQKTVGELRQDVERYKAAKNEMEGKPGSGRLIGELDSKIEETETRIRKKVLDDRETELEQKYGGLNYYQLKDVRNQKILSGDDEEWLNKKITEKASLDQLIEEHAEVVSQINALDKKSLANNPRAKHEGLDVKLRGDEEGASGDLKALRDRENELSELIADKKDEKLLNDVKKLTKTSDFEIYSKPDSKSEAAVNKIVSEGNAGNGAYPLSIDQFTGKALADELAGFGEYANKYMTDDERKSIWYLYNTQGEEKAKEYYKALLRTLNKRMTQAVEQGNEEFVKNNGVGGAILATAKSVGTNLLSGAGIVEDIIKNVSGERLDTNSVYHLNTRRTSAIRGAVAGEIENPQLSWVYQTGMSVADSAVNMAVSTAIGTLFGGEAGGAAAGVAETVSQAKNAVSIISSIIMGSQVATQTVIEAKDRGLSDSQAVSLGVIYGAVEGLTEKYSIENILSDPSSIAGMLKKSFISEGSEEVAANIADRFADALISGDKSEQVLRAKELRKQGYSDSQVLMTIVSEALGDDALSFLGGALSGVAMTGAHLGVVAGKVKAAQGLYNLGEKLEERGAAKAEGEKLKSNESFDSARLIEQAKKSGDEKTVRLAEKLETQAAQGKTISNTNLGVLKTLTDSAFAQSKNEAKAEDNAQRQRIIDSEYSADGSEEIVKQSSRSTTNAFGNKYVKGLPVKEFTKEGKTHEVMMIYSSAREAGAADNTVLLQTKDGSLINAEGATVSGDSNYTKLLSMAGSFDTLGARGLLANFDRYAQRAGEKADVVEYVKSYKQLYDAGRTGATLESIENGGKYGYSIEALGRGVAYTAVTTGNHDSDLNFRAEDNRLQRMRIPGQKNALTSKVRVEEGVVPKASAEQIQILQALAEKAGREIVLTDKVKEGVNGFFDRRSGKIYLNAEIGDDAVLSVALHEVMHGVRLDAPTEFEAVRDFVFNYLESQGKNTERMIEVVLADWRGKISERDDAVEEIVCDTVMALASDEAAARRAIESEHNADRLLKLAEAIRKIAARVKQYIKDFAEVKRKRFAADGLDVGPIARETFINDAEALMKLADMFSAAVEKARENIESYGEVKNEGEGEKYSIKETRNMQFVQQLKQAEAGKLNGSNSLFVGYAGKGLINASVISNNPFAMNQKDYRKSRRDSANNKNYSRHGVPLKFFATLPQKLNDIPLAIDNGEKITLITDYPMQDTKGNASYIILGVMKDRKMENDTVNLIKSVYPLDDMAERIKNQHSQNKLIILDKNKAKDIFATIGIQPSEVSKILDYENSVPQSEEDVKYSVSDRDLVAVHNTTAEKFLKTYKLGGLPMPSLAITKDNMTHEEYGELSFIFGKDTIDPDVNKSNKVYSGDAWTPRYPSIEYEADQGITDKLYEMARNEVADGNIEFFNPVSLHPDNIKSKLDSYGGEEGLINKFENDYGMKNLFLKETTGKSVPMQQTEEITTYSDAEIEQYEFLYNAMPTAFEELGGFQEPGKLTGKEWFEKYHKEFRKARTEYFKSIMPDITEEQLDNIFKAEKKFQTVQEARKVLKYRKEGAETRTVKDDLRATQEEIDKKVDKTEYREWLKKTFKGIEKSHGIPNGKDPYSSNGNRKTFKQLHYEETLENVVKAMKDQRNGEVGLFAGLGLWGVAAKDYGTFSAIKENEDKIKSLPSEEYSKIKQEMSGRFDEIVDYVTENGRKLSDNPYTDRDICYENILDAVRESKTKSGLIRYLKKFYGNVITEAVADDILNLIADVGNMPTEYFEAKPQRAVSFDEIKAAVIPSNASREVRDALDKLGIPYHEYEEGSKASRAEAMKKAYETKYVDSSGNEYSDLRFSVDGNGESFDNIKYAVQDDFFDDFDFEDEDLFGEEPKVNIEDVVKADPEKAVELVTWTMRNTFERLLGKYSSLKLTDTHYTKITERLFRNYSIPLEDNRLEAERFAERIAEIVGAYEKKKAPDMSVTLEELAKLCRDALLFSEITEYPDESGAKKLADILSNGIVIGKYDETEAREHFGSISNMRQQFFGNFNVRLAKPGEHGTSISELIEMVQDEIPLYAPEEFESEWDWIERVTEATKPRVYNPYMMGSQGEDIDSAAIGMAFEVLSEAVNSKVDIAKESGRGTNGKSVNGNVIRSLESENQRYKKELEKYKKSSKENEKQADYYRSNAEKIRRKESELVKAERDAYWKAKNEKYRQALEQEKERHEALKKRYHDIIDKLNKSGASWEVTERYRKRIALLEDENQTQKGIINTGQRTFRQQYIERQEKRKLVENIKRTQARLNSMIMNPTDKRYIPEEITSSGLYEALMDLCESMVIGQSSRLEDMGDLKMWRTSRIAEKLGTVWDKLNDLRKDGGDYADEFDADFMSNVNDLRERLAERKRISSKTLSLEEAREINAIINEIEQGIRYAREQIDREERITNQESGERIINDTREIELKKAKLTELLTKAGTQFLAPGRAMRMLSGYNDDAELMYHYRAINDGWEKGNLFRMRAEKHFSEFTKQHQKEYERSLSEIVEVKYKTNNGEEKTVRMTRMEGLQILMTWEREERSRTVPNKGMRHLRTSGITLANPEALSKGKRDIWTGGQRVELLNTGFIASVGSVMTEFDWEYKKLAEEYFNKISKDAINETMLKLKHRKIATSDYYVPISVDEDFLSTELESLKFDGTIEGRGSYKQIMPDATQPVLIMGLNSVIDRNIKDTASLYGLAIPIRNFKRAYKTVQGAQKADGTPVKADSVKKALREKFGDHAIELIENMITDLESPGTRTKRNDKVFWHKIEKRLKKIRVESSLVMNIGVVIKQAASYTTAGRYLSAAALTKGLTVYKKKTRLTKNIIGNKGYKAICEEIDEHTAQHYIRRLGLSEQSVAEIADSKLNKQLSKLLDKMPEALDPLKTAANPWKWIQAVDCATTAALWEACKAEINSEYKKSGKTGSEEEYWKKVTDIYDKVIEDTQPMYDGLHRATIQKDASPLVQAVFMFKTQPLQNTGILYDAAAAVVMNKGSKKAWKEFGKAVASQLASLIVFCGMTLVRDFALHKTKRRRDEEGNLTAESVIMSTLEDMLSNGINLLMPYGGSEIFNAFEIYIGLRSGKLSGFSANTLDYLNELMDKLDSAFTLVESDKSPESKIRGTIDTLGSVSEIVGIPYTNAKNITNSVWSYFIDIRRGYFLTDNNGNFDDEHIAEYMVKAKIEGDSKRAEDLERIWKEELKKSGKSADDSAKKIKDKLRAVLAENEDVKAAAQAELDGDTAAFDRAFEKVHSYGFDEKDVRSAVDKAKTAIKKQAGGGAEDAEPEEETDVDVFEDTKSVKPIKYQLSDGFEAIKRGDRDGYETVKSYLVENGYKTEEQIEKYMSSKSRTNKMWEEYLEAQYKGDNAEIKRLVKELTNVYGSWSEAKTGLEEYQNRKKNK